MTNQEWLQTATQEQLAHELQKVAHWDRKERDKAEKHYENFYAHWLGEERVEQSID